MTAKLSPIDLAELYERDIVLWSERMIELLRQGRFDELDLENLIDEVGDLGKRERDRLISSIRLIMHHLLKWEYQPEKRSRSWVKTIQRERVNVQDYLEETPSLVRITSPEWIEKAYKTARRHASIETDLPLKTFPEKCPYSWLKISDYGFSADLEDN
ncbi:MAG: DUF29 domain-containing protein [Cyanobacteria bacterium J06560_6]